MAQESLVDEPVQKMQANETDNNQSQSGSSEKLTGEELEAALKTQLEYYFSRENLAQDAYLISQMNQDLFVPISVVAQFKMVKQLCEDHDIIVRVLKSSPTVQVDEKMEKVRPLCYQRTTLILRDMPECTEEEVRAVFVAEAPKPVSARLDIANTWFVQFADEDDTKKAFDFVQGKDLKGKPLRARIKSENLLRPSAVTTKPAFKKPGEGEARGPEMSEGQEENPPMMGGYGPADMYYGQQMYYHPGYVPYYGYDPQMSYPYMRNGDERRHSGNPDRYFNGGGRGGRGGRGNHGGNRQADGQQPSNRRSAPANYYRRDSDPGQARKHDHDSQQEQRAANAEGSPETPNIPTAAGVEGDAKPQHNQQGQHRQNAAGSRKKDHSRREGHQSDGGETEHSGRTRGHSGHGRDRHSSHHEKHHKEGSSRSPQSDSQAAFDANHFPPLPGVPGVPATSPPTPPNTAEPSVDGETKPAEHKPKRLTDIVKSAPSAAAIAKAQQQQQAQAAKKQQQQSSTKTKKAHGEEEGGSSKHGHGKRHGHHNKEGHKNPEKNAQDAPTAPASAAETPAASTPATTDAPVVAPPTAPAAAPETATAAQQGATWGGQMSYADKLKLAKAKEAEAKQEATKEGAAVEKPIGDASKPDEKKKSAAGAARTSPQQHRSGGNGKPSHHGHGHGHAGRSGPRDDGNRGSKEKGAAAGKPAAGSGERAPRGQGSANATQQR